MFLFVDDNLGILFLRRISEVVETIKREIFEAFSRITTSVELDSRIGQ